jgi:hypothetical protein
MSNALIVRHCSAVRGTTAANYILDFWTFLAKQFLQHRFMI